MKLLLFAVLKGLIAPDRVLRRSAEAPKSVPRTALAVIAAGFLYALTSLALGASGAVPLWPVMDGLEADNYYFWQMVFVVPGVILAWLLVAGLLHRTRKGGAEGGGFARTLSVSGPALGGPLLVAWLPTAVQAAFMLLGMRQWEWVDILSEPGPWQTLYLAGYGLAALLAVRLFVAASMILAGRRGPAVLLRGVLAAAFVTAAFLAWVR